MSRLFETLAAIESQFAASRPSSSAVPHVYLAAYSRIRALTPFPTPAALFSALEPNSSLDYLDRCELVTALVAEHQRAPHPLWQSLLLGAFAPLLRRLRGRLRRPKDEDLDQRVLLAFLNALRSVRVGSYTILAIRWATEGEVFDAIRADRRRPDRLTAETAYDDERLHPDALRLDGEDQAAVREIVRIIEAEGGEELLDVILATKANDESLRDYVTRLHPRANDKTRAAEYGRLLRARDRLLARLDTRIRRGAAGRDAFSAA